MMRLTEVSKKALVTEFDRFAPDVLLKSEHIERLPREYREQQRYRINKPLPTDMEYRDLRNAHFTTTVDDLVSDAWSEVEAVKEELQDWFDNLPENFQNGAKGEELQSAIDELDQLSEPTVPEELGKLTVVHLVYDDGKKGRDARLSNATDQFRAAMERMEEDDMNENSEAECLRNDLDELVSNLEGISCPGMF